MKLKSCPFCGSNATLKKESTRVGYGSYEEYIAHHVVVCDKCGSSGKRLLQKALIDFTKYTVNDFRQNPILRAKVGDEYDAYVEQLKILAEEAWNKRVEVK